MSNLQTHLRALLPDGVAVEATGIPRDHVRPADAWRAMLPERCSDKRLAEFAVGRYCVSRALSRLGAQHTQVGVGPGREPLAPSGYTVSISHDNHHAVAVAGRAAQWPGLGVDVEADDPLDPELVPVVCRDDELANKPAALSAENFAKQLFSVKESVFKAVYSHSGVALDWHQITVTSSDSNQFSACVTDLHYNAESIDGITQHLPDLGKWISFAVVR